MSIRAGRLRHRVEFQPKIETVNVNQQTIKSWDAANSFVVPCEATRHSEQNATFVIRWRSDVFVDSHRIVAWGAYWTLNNAVEDFTKSTMTIASDFTSLLETTHMLSVEREYIENIPVVRPPSE